MREKAESTGTILKTCNNNPEENTDWEVWPNKYVTNVAGHIYT